MNDKIPHLFSRLLLVALALLIAFVAYQSYAPGTGLESIKRKLDDAGANIKLH